MFGKEVEALREKLAFLISKKCFKVNFFEKELLLLSSQTSTICLAREQKYL